MARQILLLWLFLGLGLLAAVAHANPSPASLPADATRIEFLDKQEDITAHYCLTDGYFKDCAAPHNRVAVIYPSRAFAQLILDHVSIAMREGYAREISGTDLFHGHLIYKDSRTEFDDADEIFKSVTAVVYHSAERQSRWHSEAVAGLPSEKRTPRSFVGFTDGTVKKAVDLAAPGVKLKTYEDAGTIYTEELVESHPEWVFSKDGWSSFGGTPKITLNVCRAPGKCAPCKFELVANFAKISDGRFTAITGEKMDVFARCRFDDHAN